MLATLHGHKLKLSGESGDMRMEWNLAMVDVHPSYGQLAMKGIIVLKTFRRLAVQETQNAVNLVYNECNGAKSVGANLRI